MKPVDLARIVSGSILTPIVLRRALAPNAPPTAKDPIALD